MAYKSCIVVVRPLVLMFPGLLSAAPFPSLWNVKAPTVLHENIRLFLFTIIFTSYIIHTNKTALWNVTNLTTLWFFFMCS